MTSEELALRASAVFFALNGIMFGLPALNCIRSLSAGEGVPTLFGFPAYGGGPFEGWGISTTVPLVTAFLAVCAAEVIAAWLVWDGRLVGGWLGLALLPAGAIFWYGFALPFPPIFAVVRTLLLWYGWQAFSS